MISAIAPILRSWINSLLDKIKFSIQYCKLLLNSKLQLDSLIYENTFVLFGYTDYFHLRTTSLFLKKDQMHFQVSYQRLLAPKVNHIQLSLLVNFYPPASASRLYSKLTVAATLVAVSKVACVKLISYCFYINYLSLLITLLQPTVKI